MRIEMTKPAAAARPWAVLATHTGPRIVLSGAGTSWPLVAKHRNRIITAQLVNRTVRFADKAGHPPREVLR